MFKFFIFILLYLFFVFVLKVEVVEGGITPKAKQGQQKPISPTKFYGQNVHNNTTTNTNKIEEAKKQKEKEKEVSKKDVEFEAKKHKEKEKEKEETKKEDVEVESPDSWKKHPEEFAFSPPQTSEKKRKVELESKDLPTKKKFCGEEAKRLFHYDTPENADENLTKEFHKNSPIKHESKPNILNTHTKIENLQTENLAKVEGGEVETPESWKKQKENEDFSFQQSQDSVNSKKEEKEKKGEMNEDFSKILDLGCDDINLECNEDLSEFIQQDEEIRDEKMTEKEFDEEFDEEFY